MLLERLRSPKPRPHKVLLIIPLNQNLLHFSKKNNLPNPFETLDTLVHQTFSTFSKKLIFMFVWITWKDNFYFKEKVKDPFRYFFV